MASERAEAPADLYRIADCILSGLSGNELARVLAAEFPNVTRADAFSAIGLAAAVFRADLAMAEIELYLAQRGATAEIK